MEIIFYFFLLFTSFMLFIKFVVYPRKKENLPPSPLYPLPIIGHLYYLKKPLHKTLAKLSNKYGAVLYLHFGSRPILVVSSPSAVEECLTKENDIVFANRPRLIMGRLLGHNYQTLVWAPYGEHWRNLRRISAIHILSTNRVQSFSGKRLQEVESMIKRLGSHGDQYRSVDMSSVFSELTLNNMMKMIAGKTYYGEDVEEIEEVKQFKLIVKETLSLSGTSDACDFLPILRWVGLTGFEKRVLSLKEKRDKFLQELIEERRRLRSEEPGEKNTLLDILMTSQDNDPDYYTDEMIRGFIWVMFAAGTETSTCTMEWAMSLLLNNPQVLQKAKIEIDQQVGKGRLLTESDVNKLPFLQNIITETLRIYPPGPLLPHESSEDCIIGGYNVPRGTLLLVNLWAIQNDPHLWVEPNKFDPERLSGLEGTRDGFKLLPFGLGRRGCPGEGLAMRTIGSTLGALIQCFDWKRAGEEMVDMSEGRGLTLPKVEPLVLMCRPRSSLMQVHSSLSK